MSVLQLLEQKLLPPGHFIMVSYLNANCWRQVHSTGLATAAVMYGGADFQVFQVAGTSEQLSTEKDGVARKQWE